MNISYIKKNTFPDLKGKVAIFGAGELGQRLYDFYSNKNKELFIIDDYLAHSGKNTSVIKSAYLKTSHFDHIILATLKSRKRMLQTVSNINFNGNIIIFEGEDDDIFAPPRN